MNRNKLEFWNERACLADNPGSDDFLLKEIEQMFVMKHLSNNIRVLDLGCGDGSTLLKIKQSFDVKALGIDFSDQMIQRAKANTCVGFDIDFLQSSVLSLPQDIGMFDLIYTQRCLINLNSFEEQSQAILNISDLLNPNGLFVMIESTNDGLNNTNDLRLQLGLEAIKAPWHNTFFNIQDVTALQNDVFKIIEFENISSTYSFLSRVVYGKLAQQTGEELRYDSEINKLAALLPQNIGNFGPVKGWVWKKLAEGQV